MTTSASGSSTVNAGTQEPAAHAGVSPPDAPLPDWFGSPESQPFPAGVDKSALPIGAPRCFRHKVHLAFVASEPCLVCARRLVDRHHVRFAQGQATFFERKSRHRGFQVAGPGASWSVPLHRGNPKLP
jgi:hypothetical protein